MSPNWILAAIKATVLLAIIAASLQLLGYIDAQSTIKSTMKSTMKSTTHSTSHSTTHSTTHSTIQSNPNFTSPHLAKQVLAADLLARLPSRTNGVIPKIFHQSWKSLELPSKFDKWSTSCREKHKDWEWVVWTDEDNLHLVQKYFPWLEETYDGMPGVIYRADTARHLYMYIYGGVYADLDIECLQPTEDLEKTYGPMFTPSEPPKPDQAIFGRMGDLPEFEHSIPNAWMAASPGNPFFLSALNHIMDIYEKSKSGQFFTPEQWTGPISLRDSIVEYETNKIIHGPALGETVSHLTASGPFTHDQTDNHQVMLLPSHFIYPYSWAYDNFAIDDCWVLKDSFDAERCKEKLETEKAGSITITYWSHTHSPTGHSEDGIKHISSS